MGVQLAAPFGHERRLLELAFELEAAAPLAHARRLTDGAAPRQVDWGGA